MTTTTQTGGLSSQTLEGADGADNTDIIYGDANKLKGTTVGGDDTIIGGDDGAINYLYGDAYSMEGKSKGGADTITGGSNGATNYIYGDAYSMQGKVKGGNDILFGGLDSTNIIYGDAYNMRDRVMGGDDLISIDSNKIINAPGFKDFILAGGKLDLTFNYNYENLNNILSGDAYKITDSTGGNDFISLFNDINISFQNVFISCKPSSLLTYSSLVDLDISNNRLIGDSVILDNSVGGDDVLNISNRLLDTVTDLNVISRGHSNIFLDYSVNFIAKDNIVFGDSEIMLESKGGDDVISVGNDFVSNITSLGSSASNNSTAKNSISTNYALKDNNLYGDAETMNHSTGGNDTLSVGNDFVVSVVGPLNANSDASSTATIFISTAFLLNNNNLFGDAETMNHSKGGDDTLSIGVGILDDPNIALTLDIKDNALYGDAKTMTHSQGGNDKLTGADGRGSVTYLYGDAQFTDGHSKAGDDVLTSGQGNDQMWGDFASVVNPSASSNDHDHEDDDEGDDDWDEHESDHDDDHHALNPYKYAGKDTFVFKENNGNDTIFDFQHGLDKIDLSAANIFSFDGLTIDQDAAHPSDSVIDLGGGNSITLVGVNHLEASDFVFAALAT